VTNTPIKDAIDKLDTLPAKEAEIGAVATKGGDLGVKGHVSVPIGKGWSFGAAGEWMRETGYSVAAVFGWKGKR
jgi:hypothetical protein